MSEIKKVKKSTITASHLADEDPTPPVIDKSKEPSSVIKQNTEAGSALKNKL